jgi:cell division transport system permease protein
MNREVWQHYQHALHRAKRATRDNVRLYLVPVLSLTIAFLFLSFAFLVITNLSSVAERWRQSGRVTVYLVDDVAPSHVQELKQLLRTFTEVRTLRHLTKGEARSQLLAQSEDPQSLDGLPVDLFPDSLEIEFTPEVTATRRMQLVTQVQTLPGVQSVETYQTWFGKLDRALSVGNALAWGLAVLVALCVLAVVSSTIRLAMTSRKQEIEVLKLCGATNSYVRRPFVIEGAVQGLVASSLALILLGVGYFFLDGFAGALVRMVTGASLLFLSPAVMFALLAGGALIGAAASAYSTRTYLLS